MYGLSKRQNLFHENTGFLVSLIDVFCFGMIIIIVNKNISNIKYQLNLLKIMIFKYCRI